MGQFKQHERCTNCGSRDNFARYDDGGGFCFGCHFTVRPTHAPMRNMGSTSEDDSRTYYAIPEDAGTLYGEAAVEWLARFHVDVPTAIRHGVVWSPSREQLIYKLGNVWQARNFGQGGGNKGRPRSKNFTSGDVNECLHIYSGQLDERFGGTRLVVVEDPVSALRIADSGARCDAMPLLGSHLAAARLNAIAGLYQSLVFWLDSDKYKEARSMEQRAKYMGLSARTIYTDEDPKVYTNEEINKILLDTLI